MNLLLNIKNGDKYNKIKSMADYRGYYVKKMYGAEDNGTVIVIYNTSEKDYTKSTEDVKVVFDGYKNGKIDFIDYSTNGFGFTFHYKDSNGYVEKYGEDDIDFNNTTEAFKYINKRIGYNG